MNGPYFRLLDFPRVANLFRLTSLKTLSEPGNSVWGLCARENDGALGWDSKSVVILIRISHLISKERTRKKEKATEEKKGTERDQPVKSRRDQQGKE